MYLCGRALPIGQGLEQQLERALEEHPGIRLVILDTLQKVRIESGNGMSYAADYRDASALKSVADRYHVCLLAIHHLRKLPDEDPFNRLAGTNGLSGAADGSLVLLRTKRQENTAVLSATGRDIEDQEETLEFDDCRWNGTTDPEQMQFGLLVMLLQKLLRQEAFQGTATELAEWLGKEGLLFGPAQLSRYLQSRGRQLAEAGIGLEVSRTIDVPQEVPKRGILQYVHSEAERMEKRFRCGMEEDDRTTFEQYAAGWLARQTHYKASTLAGYKRQLEVVYPYIGGVTLNKLRPLILEEMCAELRKRKNRRGEPLCEATVHKYLETVSAVLEDAKRNDILLYNPAHRVRGVRVEKKVQRVPAEFEMRKLMQCILQEPLLYRVFYLTAITTGMRRGELCALRWNDLHGGGTVTVQHSRSSVLGQGIVESSTKNHRTRTVVIPELVHDYMGELFLEQAREGRIICRGTGASGFFYPAASQTLPEK